MPILRSGRDYDNGWDYGVGSTDAGSAGDGPPAELEDPNAPVEAPVEECFWPVLRKHGLGRAEPGERPVKCACPICYEHISMAGLSTLEEEGKQGLIAPCGHVMCPDCWPRLEWDPETDAFTTRRCPVCRLPIQCYWCTQSVIKELVPDATCDVKELEFVPKTTTETSVPYEAICVECHDIFEDILDPMGWWYKPRGPGEERS